MYAISCRNFPCYKETGQYKVIIKGSYYCVSSWGITIIQYVWPLSWHPPWKVQYTPDSKIHGANIGPNWGRQDPGEPHVGPMNFAIWDTITADGLAKLGVPQALFPNKEKYSRKKLNKNVKTAKSHE